MAGKATKKEVQKTYHDRNAKPLPQLKKGETVKIYDQKKSIWGEGNSKRTGRTSFVQRGNDNVQYRRNRKHLKKVASEAEDREEKESTSKPTKKQVKIKTW